MFVCLCADVFCTLAMFRAAPLREGPAKQLWNDGMCRGGACGSASALQWRCALRWRAVEHAVDHAELQWRALQSRRAAERRGLPPSARPSPACRLGTVPPARSYSVCPTRVPLSL